MSVTWSHPAAATLFHIWLATPRPERDSVRHAWLALADRLETDPWKAGEPFDGAWRAARVGPLVAFYQIAEAGAVRVDHTTRVVRRAE